MQGNLMIDGGLVAKVDKAGDDTGYDVVSSIVMLEGSSLANAFDSAISVSPLPVTMNAANNNKSCRLSKFQKFNSV